MFKFFKAFTLAETLIVMGIIGVVAALTLPNLNSSTGDRERVAKVKKIYQNLTDAFGRAEAVYGYLGTWPIAKDCDASHFNCINYERITDFLKITKESNYSLGGRFKYIDGTDAGKWDDLDIYYCYFLADGAILYVTGKGLIVDIDGENKGSKTFGKDVFIFSIDENTDYELVSDGNNTSCFSSGNCTNWVVQYGNMDYLKADSNGKCKNSSIVLDGVNNTSCK